MKDTQNIEMRIFVRLKKMIDERKRRGLKTMEMWSTGKKVFKWWMEDENLDGQLAFDLDGNIYEEYT